MKFYSSQLPTLQRLDVSVSKEKEISKGYQTRSFGFGISINPNRNMTEQKANVDRITACLAYKGWNKASNICMAEASSHTIKG